MSKNILILSSSPRRGGNSDTLCDEFMRGAIESGNQVEKIFLRDKNIHPCTGCSVCSRYKKPCPQKDDVAEVIEKMLAADVIVMGTPVYFYAMSAQMKMMIDRCCGPYTEMKNKEFYFIATAAEEDETIMDRIVANFMGFLDCLENPTVKGTLFCGGVWHAGEIKGSPKLPGGIRNGQTGIGKGTDYDTGRFSESYRGRRCARYTGNLRLMDEMSDEARRITCEINNTYHSQEELRALMSRLLGKPVDETFKMFPPFYTDFGRNITIGRHVFINACCHFQDHGGVTLGDGCLIGHQVGFATLDHGRASEDRGVMYPAPIRLGKNVMVGSNSTILRGVTVGDNAIICRRIGGDEDVAANTVAGGVPARYIRDIDRNEKPDYPCPSETGTVDKRSMG